MSPQQQLLQKKKDMVQLCSVRVGDSMYGIETSTIREVLGKAVPRRVPLAPEYIAGVLTYRGAVLEAVSLRTLMGLEGAPQEECVMVLDDGEGGSYGLLVDSVGGMAAAEESSRENNPATLGTRNEAIFNGVYRLGTGLMSRLNMERLRPAELARSGMPNADAKGTRMEVR